MGVVCLAWASTALADIKLPTTDPSHPIYIAAAEARHWQEGEQEVWVLKGNCSVSQGGIVAMGEDAVIWIDYAKPFRLTPHRITVYLEKNVRVSSTEAATGYVGFEGGNWLGKFYTNSRIELPVDRTKSPPAVAPAIYHRGRSVQPDAETSLPAETVQPIDQIQYEADGPMAPTVDVQPAPNRMIRLLNRYSTGFQSSYFEDPVTGEAIGMFDSGINFIIDGQTDLDTVSLLADRVVIWSKEGVSEYLQQDGPLGPGQYEFYL